MVVLEPMKVIITNYHYVGNDRNDDNDSEMLEIDDNLTDDKNDAR
ncbi:MAG: hypothetical protein WKF59_21670 [Chitinophagaceae bacterium]